MGNPFFGVMGGNKQPNMMQQFQQFMNQMKGQDPNAIIQEMMPEREDHPTAVRRCPPAGPADAGNV